MTAPVVPRRTRWLPATLLGRGVVGLEFAFVACVALNFVIEGAGQVAGWAGLAGGALALVAVALRRERAVLVLAAVPVALFVMSFEAAELIAGW